MSTLISLAKTAIFASYLPRNAFSACHDPRYDVIGQTLEGVGVLKFSGGTLKRWTESYIKNSDIRPVNKKRYSWRTAGGGVASTPPVPARVNPRPAGPLDFPPPAGGGGVWTPPPPMISAPGRRREKRKAAFESSRKIISKSFQSFFSSGQNWGHQGPKFQNFPKRFFDNKIVNFKGRAMNLIPSCLSR